MVTPVTWLLPVKNGMPYLPETLASIAAQTYSNWEILAWDNGSTDGTIEELHRWIPSQLPGKVVTGHPLSLGNCLAEMVKQCETELCARIDADDVNLPERLATQIEFLHQHPEIAVVGTQVYRIDESGTNYGLFRPYPLHHDDIVHFLMRACVIWHPSVLFRRSKILEAGNYQDIFIDGMRSPTEDYDLWLRMACHYQLANLAQPLLCYRVHSRSITQANSKATVVDDCFCRNATALYGCSEQDARLLREWRHPRAVHVLKQIAGYLQQTQHSSTSNHLSSPSFLEAGRQMMSSKQMISCFNWAMLNHNKHAVLAELLSLSSRGWSLLRKNLPIC